MAANELAAGQLYRPCDPGQFDFQTTEELAPLEEIIGQPRAVEAVRFGIDIRQDGYNIFALGAPGVGKRTVVLQYLMRRVAGEPPPLDWCYINNFDEPYKPKAMGLPAGRGPALRDDMNQFLEDLQGALVAAFESEEYRQGHQALQQQLAQQQEQAIQELQEKAKGFGLGVVPTPVGLSLVPLDNNGRPLPPHEASKLDAQRRQELEEASDRLQEQTQELIGKAPQYQRQARWREKQLRDEVAEHAVGPLIAELKKKYQGMAAAEAFLDAVMRDVIASNEELLAFWQHQTETGEEAAAAGQGPAVHPPVPQVLAQQPMLRRYRVNVLVSHDPAGGAPLVVEDHPNYPNLVGRVDYIAQMGTLVADFNLIKGGALHRANGGYLILDVLKVLMQPAVWEALKRAVRGKEIRIESLGEALGLIHTVTLEPEPIPLDVKVVLLGSPLLYHLLRELDTEFAELFKVPADFQMAMDRNEDDQLLYARLIGTIARHDGLRPFGREAVARIIERGSRMASDGRKLSLHMRSLCDLLHEAHYWAGHNGNPAVRAEDVDCAISAQVYRSDRMREEIQEAILRNELMIDTQGQVVGQVNGLAVWPFGDFYFGRPNRITARVRMGSGEVVDIEREVALGGPLHSKGVLILSGFLAGRYARKMPLSLAASLVFEQSYGGTEGDSASSAELYALLSAIADVPIRQGLAVTGSVNQLGLVQAIGAVNEKIEGFFDICRQRGLSGEQGVLVPAANVEHLMLRGDVRQAVEDGKFHIYAVSTIDEGIELLTGMSAGTTDAAGRYPADTINGRVQAVLEEFAQLRRQFAPMPAAHEEHEHVTPRQAAAPPT